MLTRPVMRYFVIPMVALRTGTETSSESNRRFGLAPITLKSYYFNQDMRPRPPCSGMIDGVSASTGF